MTSVTKRVLMFTGATLCAGVLASLSVGGTPSDPNLQDFNDISGQVRTVSTTGAIDTTNPFFQSLGTNGRACVTCHQPSDGWSMSMPNVMARFAANPKDPLFNPVDGAVCPTSDVSTAGKQKAAYALLLKFGLIRVSMPIPAGAEFVLTSVLDPYGCNGDPVKGLGLYRRPRPATNLGFATEVMWDGRESPAGNTLTQSLTSQALHATLGHAQATTPPTADQLAAIVALETSVVTAQDIDNTVGNLSANGALGGPNNILTLPFYPGINDSLGGGQFNSAVFNLSEPWRNNTDPNIQSIIRGQDIFNNRKFNISGVAGFNDDFFGGQAVMATCSTCHNTPNVGNHSVAGRFMNVSFDTPFDTDQATIHLPAYTLQCVSGPLAGTTFSSTDPGRAMISGKCADIGRFAVPNLRGLAARKEYFHNGVGRENTKDTALHNVIALYKRRFAIVFSPRDVADLANFLATL